MATGGLRPDVTLVLDLPPEVGRERQAVQGKSPDRMELADVGLHRRVAEAFRAADGPGVVHLDGAAPPGDVERRAWEIVRSRLDGTPGEERWL